jgi:hypothetical protein
MKYQFTPLPRVESVPYYIREIQEFPETGPPSTE